jgi:hypothetical protein
MRRITWVVGMLVLALGACAESDALNNSRAAAYLIDGVAQIPDARRQAEIECAQINREPRLSNVTIYQRALVVFDCQPPGNVRFEIRPGLTPPGS